MNRPFELVRLTDGHSLLTTKPRNEEPQRTNVAIILIYFHHDEQQSSSLSSHCTGPAFGQALSSGPYDSPRNRQGYFAVDSGTFGVAF